MITYDKINEKNIQKAMDFCKENGTEFPIPYEVAFGAFDDGVIIGVCVLRKVYQIEPLVSNAKYGGVPHILSEKIMACASLVTSEITALVKKDENIDLFRRVGFTIRDKNITSIYKEI